MDARDVIARKIVERREALGFTQQHVAERAQIALRSYQRYESAESMPRKLARRKVAMALELEHDALEPPKPDASTDEPGTREQLAEVLNRLARLEDLLTDRALSDLEESAGDPPIRTPVDRREESGS